MITLQLLPDLPPIIFRFDDPSNYIPDGVLTKFQSNTGVECLNITCQRCPIGVAKASIAISCGTVADQLLAEHYPNLHQTNPEYFL